MILPNRGIEEWDREGNETYDPEAFAEFCDEMRLQMQSPIAFSELDCHINDAPFVAKVLEIFDAWVADGTIKTSA